MSVQDSYGMDFEAQDRDNRHRRASSGDAMKHEDLTPSIGRVKLPDLSNEGVSCHFGKQRPPDPPKFQRNWVAYERAIRYWRIAMERARVGDDMITMTLVSSLEWKMQNRCYLALDTGKIQSSRDVIELLRKYYAVDDQARCAELMQSLAEFSHISGERKRDFIMRYLEIRDEATLMNISELPKVEFFRLLQKMRVSESERIALRTNAESESVEGLLEAVIRLYPDETRKEYAVQNTRTNSSGSSKGAGKSKGKGNWNTGKLQPNECWDFRKTGKCRFGDACRWKHGNPPGTSDKRDSKGNGRSAAPVAASFAQCGKANNWAVIDTGFAGEALAGQQWLSQHYDGKLSPPSETFVFGNGAVSSSLGCVVLDLSVGSTGKNTVINVVEGALPLLLGMKFLEKNGCVIDLSKGLLSVGSEFH